MLVLNLFSLSDIHHELCFNSNLNTSILYLLQTNEPMLDKTPHGYDKLVLILEIMSVLSPCTAEFKRGFSQMKQLKAAFRITLTHNNVHNLMISLLPFFDKGR